jgi:hypothetical protein
MQYIRELALAPLLQAIAHGSRGCYAVAKVLARGLQLAVLIPSCLFALMIKTTRVTQSLTLHLSITSKEIRAF